MNKNHSEESFKKYRSITFRAVLRFKMAVPWIKAILFHIIVKSTLEGHLCGSKSQLKVLTLTRRIIIKNKIAIYCLMMGSLLISSCASTQQSMLIGVGTGVATGAATGAILNKRSRGKWAVYGLAIGGTIGGLSGYTIHNSLKRRDEKIRKETLLRFNEFMSSMSFKEGSGDNPKQSAKERGIRNFKVASPEVDKNCLDWEIQGNRLLKSTVFGPSMGGPFGCQLQVSPPHHLILLALRS